MEPNKLADCDPIYRIACEAAAKYGCTAEHARWVMYGERLVMSLASARHRAEVKVRKEA